MSLSGAWACAICAPADGQSTLLYQLHAADAAVIAAPEPVGARWRILETVKGTAPSEAGMEMAAATRAIAAAPGAGTPSGPTLWLYNTAGRSWRVMGPLSATRVSWARQLAQMRPVSVEPPSDWPARLGFFAGDLEDSDPLVARVAYEELSVAPYGVMRELRRRWPLERLRQWTLKTAQTDRLPLYLLLLGVAGSEADAARIEAALPAATDATGIAARSAALAALIELRGDTAVGWLERDSLGDASRSSFEVQAAVMALGVHAADGGRIQRARVVRAYEILVQSNPAQAGLTASDLASWGEWRFGTRFAQILKSDAPLAFASRYPMVFFLLRSPRPEDRAAVQALRAAGRL